MRQNHPHDFLMSQNTEGSSFEIDSNHHPLMVVMSPDCDLEQDFKVRFATPEAREQYHSETVDETLPAVIPQVLLCDLYEESQIKERMPGTDIWKRVRQNQD